ncbi:MAG: cyclic nucleotide-binding domain-containing protein [Dehalococcoidia bacterium]
MSEQAAHQDPAATPLSADPGAFLRQTELFRNLPEETLNEIQAALQPRTVPAGTVVCREGDPGDELYFIASGELETSANIGGAQARLGVMRPGDLFGEIAVLRRSARTATVTALTEARVLSLSRTQLLAVVRRYPELGAALQNLMRRRELRSRMRALQ